jgi:hypothetical protein
MPTNETLYKQIQQKMSTKEVSKKLASWLKQAKKTQSYISEHKMKFNQWKPLKFYVALGNSSTFSIRYKGQEVAVLNCSTSRKPMVKMDETLLEKNKRYFKYSPEDNEFEWSGAEGTRFRNHFSTNDFSVHSPEHCIESGLIAGLISLRKPPKSTLRKRTAVTFKGFPLQFPVPFSASKGAIGDTSGHVDILGRKRPGVLSVWELKSPNVYKGVARQAYTYALQVYSIINDPAIGKDWLELFGFSKRSKTPKVEIVIAVSEKYTQQVTQEIRVLKEEMKADGIEELFSWNIAGFSPDLDPHRIVIHQIL